MSADLAASAGAPPSEATVRVLERALLDARPSDLPAPPRARILALRAIVLFAKVGVVLAVPLTIAVLLAVPIGVRFLLDLRIPGLGLACLAGIGAVLWACREAWRGVRERTERAVVLTPRDAPKLFAWVTRIARVADTEPPDEVVVGWDTSFAVEEASERTSDGRAKRRLHMEPANLGGLTLAEVTAILVHEMAHFRGGHTSHAARSFRAARRLFHLEWILRQQSGWRFDPVYWVVALASRAYERVYGSISRTQEREADELAFALVGGACFERGLEKVHLGSLRHSLFAARALSEWSQRVESDGDEDAATFDVFDRIVGAPLDDARAREWVDAQLSRAPEHGDRHPPGAERIRAARAWDREHPRDVAPELTAAGDPWPYFFGARLPELQRRVVDRELGVAKGERESAIGVRGGWLGHEERDAAKLDLVAPSHGRLVPVATILLGFGALLVGALALLLAEPGERRHGFTIVAVGAALTVYGPLGLRRRITVDRDGFALRGRFGTRRGSWSDVEAVKVTETTVAWKLTGGSTCVLAPARGVHARLTDVVLERAPCAAVVGWGTGLARVPRPADDAPRPTLVRPTDEGLVVEGPGEQSITIASWRRDFELVRDFVNDRLLEWVNTGRRPKRWRDPVDVEHPV